MSEDVPTPACTTLCIEDDPDVFAVIEMILNMSSEPRILWADRGAAGVAMAHEDRPDLILLDLRLPDLPGREVLRQIKGNDRTCAIPVVVISADLTARVAADLLQLGAALCLRKPFSIANFLTAVEAAAETV